MRFIRPFASLLEIVRNPTSNLTVAVLLLAIVIIIVLITITVLLMYAQVGGRRPRRTTGRQAGQSARGAVPRRGRHPGKTGAGSTSARRQTVRAAPSEFDPGQYEYPELAKKPTAARSDLPLVESVRRFMLGPGPMWLIAVLAVAAVVLGFYATSQDSYCVDACHARSGGNETHAKDVHRKVACVDCHERPGAAGVVDAGLTRAIHSVANYVDLGAYSRPVTSASCLSCHAAAISGPTSDAVRGTRMSHTEPLAAGMTCTDCHPGMGHRETTTTAGMSTCVRCHDGDIASAECSRCHTKDTSRAIRRTVFTRRLFPRTRLGPPTDCGGCHSQTKCDRCHGLRLPHSPRFLSWEHARSAGFEKKKLCWRCHTIGDCTSGGCHDGGGFDAHGLEAVWRERHGDGGKGLCSCHWQKLPADGQAAVKDSFCAVCH